MRFDNLRADVKNWGWMRSLFIRFMSRLGKYAGTHLYRVTVRPLPENCAAPDLPGGFTVRELRRDDLLEAARDPQLDLDADFVEAALTRGDLAFGAFDGARLVSYSWRTFSAASHADGLWFKVDRPYNYAYKGFTRQSHRRMRLHVALTFVADARLRERGYTAEVGFFELSNFASRATARLLGRKGIGYTGYVKWFGTCVPFRSPAVGRIGAGFFRPPADSFCRRTETRGIAAFGLVTGKCEGTPASGLLPPGRE